MNVGENVMMSIPGIVCLVWVLHMLLRKPQPPDRFMLSVMIIQGVLSLVWFIITIMVWTVKGGHPPGAGMAAIVGVLLSIPMLLICVILFIISLARAQTITAAHVEPMSMTFILLGLVGYAALFIR